MSATLLSRTIDRRAGTAPRSTVDWRSEVLNTLLRVVFVLGTVTAIPSILLSIQVEMPIVAILDGVAVLWVALIALRTDLPYRARAASLVVLGYVLGIVLLVTIGTTSQIYLMAVPVLTALLLGLRQAIVALVVSSLSLFAVGYLSNASLTVPGLEDQPFVEWVVIAMNFLFIAAIITILTAVLLERLERSLMHASRLSRAVEQAREGIVIGDANGRVIYANAAFAAMTGVDRATLSDGWFSDVPLATIDGATMAETVASADGRTGRLILTRIGDPALELEAVVSAMVEHDGDVGGTVVVLRDLTAERQMEARLRQGERLEALGTLAGGVAHDFNNIIASILAVAEASRDETHDGRTRGDLDRIVVASHRAREIVRRMLAFSRHSMPARQPVSVRDMVDEAVPLLRAALPANIDLRAHASTGATVMADPSEVHQILMNLTTNAAHAMAGMDRGTLSIEVTSVVPDATFATLHPGVDAGRPYVRLAVTDSGRGIDRAVLPRIFEPFFTTKPGHEGTGLGLATVHGIVTSLGGAIDAYSEIDNGTTFRVYLPLLDPSPDTAPVSAADAAPGPAEGKRILVVDDEETIRVMTERVLVRMGYQVTTAADGITAEQTFREDADAFDLVMTDLTMPGLSGAGLIRLVHEVRPGMPVILTSGFSDSMPDVERATLDMAFFLQKPYTRAELASKMATALSRAPT